MKRHDQLTFFRNRHRAAELRQFREAVEAYFVRSERDTNDVPLDWDGAQAARSRINQMLPRVVQVVRAAGLGGGPVSTSTDPGPGLGRVEVLHRIFGARYGDGLDQEILDVIDMALGVYESGKYAALARTINPLHYAGTLLGFLARGPRKLFAALGAGGRSGRIRDEELARLEAAAARLANVEELLEERFAAIQDRQSARQAEQNRQLTELAERLDFAERVLAQRRPAEQLPPPSSKITTPV